MHSCCKHDDRVVVHLMRSFFGIGKYLFTDNWFFLSEGLYIALGGDCNQLYFSPLVGVGNSLLMIVVFIMKELFFFLSGLL